MARKAYKDLSPEAKEARRNYHREWAAKNPERVKEANRRFWERKAQAEAAGKEAGVNGKQKAAYG